MRSEAMHDTDWSLPLFVTETNKVRVAIFGWIIGAGMYLLSNHFPIFPPRVLPMSWVDQSVPFVPETVWIYVSEYIFFLAVYFTAKNVENVNRYIYGFIALQSTSVLIFLVWPTTFPRELFPFPENLDTFTYFIFDQLRMTDAPNNCFPSLHVSSVFLSVFVFLNEQRRKFPFFLIWGSAIALSTLTTKQHYLIDVIGGLAMAVLFFWIFDRLVPYRGAQAKR